MEKENDVNVTEDTGSFTELMSRSERKEWERNKRIELEEKLKIEEARQLEEKKEELLVNGQPKKKESKKERKKRLEEEKKRKENENSEIDSIIKNEESLQPIETDFDELDQDIVKTNELTIGELSNATIDHEMNDEEFHDIKVYSNSFNPIPLIGIGTIISFIYYIYLIFISNYDNTLFLLINGGILLLIIFIFCISSICNKKSVNILAIINSILIVCFIIFNIISIINWDIFEDKAKTNSIEPNNIKEKEIKEEKIIENNYSCINKENNIEINVKDKNGYIYYLKRIEVYENASVAEEMKSYFEDRDGFIAIINEETLMTEYNFDILNINQYKLIIKGYNDAFNINSDFTYIVNDKISYSKYKEIELDDFTCTKKES